MVARGRGDPARHCACEKAGKQGEKGPATMTTSTWSFGSGRGRRSGGGAVRRWRPQAWRRRRCRLGLRGKEAAVAGCAEPRAWDGGFIGRPRVP
jgi:hypothetical protein